MIKKEPIISERVRRIEGAFGWIPREFIVCGHIKELTREELLLYFFLVAVGDRQGLSFYGDKRVCEILKIDQDTLKRCRIGLEEKSYIEYEKPLYQVLSLPKIGSFNEEQRKETGYDR